MSNHKVKFDDLCREHPKEGYALNYDFEVIYRANLKEDTANVCKTIKDCIKEIQKGTERKIKKYWIHKTYARKKHKTFDSEDSSTWSDSNVENRYSTYKRKDGIDGMVVVAAVDKDACSDAQEHTLSLKKTVVGELKQKSRKIKGTTRKGNKDDGKSPAYILYLTYKFVKH